eukprot:326696-Alexandrium_andersonii.AAC.1
MSDRVALCWRCFTRLAAANPEDTCEGKVCDLTSSQPREIDAQLRRDPRRLDLQSSMESEQKWIQE